MELIIVFLIKRQTTNKNYRMVRCSDILLDQSNI